MVVIHPSPFHKVNHLKMPFRGRKRRSMNVCPECDKDTVTAYGLRMHRRAQHGFRR